MNLKESYRYANYLDTLLNTSYRYLQKVCNYYKTESFTSKGK